MKLIQRTILLILSLFFVSSLSAAQLDLTMPANAATAATAKEMKKAERAQKRAVRKEMRKAMVKNLFAKKDKKDDVDDLLLIILAILIPPLAVYLYDGDTTNRFWLNLILAVIGWGSFTFIIGIGILPAIVHALLIVTGTI